MLKQRGHLDETPCSTGARVWTPERQLGEDKWHLYPALRKKGGQKDRASLTGDCLKEVRGSMRISACCGSELAAFHMLALVLEPLAFESLCLLFLVTIRALPS